jgi:hypothetical protein
VSPDVPGKEKAMTPTGVTVDQWVDMFRAIGLDDEAMRRWHVEFESRHPEGHRSFLEWLGLPEEKVDEIRRRHAS